MAPASVMIRGRTFAARPSARGSAVFPGRMPCTARSVLGQLIVQKKWSSQLNLVFMVQSRLVGQVMGRCKVGNIFCLSSTLAFSLIVSPS
jgi:hypothetical protein